ncbi:OmpC Outer membrane protein (porin) [Burkholderiaceae bacterium]
MKRNVILAMAMGATAFSAVAQSNQLKTAGNWEFYGRAHLALENQDDGDKYKANNLSSNSSRVGLRGDKSFGDLKGIWQIESEIQFNRTEAAAVTGTTQAADKAGTNTFASRDTFAGVEGSFGQVKIGKFDTPMKVARGAADLFGDQLGDMRNITRAGAKFDERPNNIIQYQSPDMSGVRVAVAYAPQSTGVAAMDTATGIVKETALTSLSVSYNAGDLSAALAQESYEKDHADGKRDAMRLAVSYKVMSDLKLVGFFQEANYMKTPTDDQGSKVTGFGAEYQIVPNHTVLRAHVMDRAANKANSDSKLTAVGIDRIISKELRFYANYAMVTNGSAVKVAPWSEGKADGSKVSPAVNGKDTKGFAIGMRYDF